MATTCATVGCGDHGVCNAYEMCACTEGWSGQFCATPPPQNIKCTASDATFQGLYGGDMQCGNYGVYGKCLSSGVCDCTGMEGPSSGTRCEVQCATDNDCGGRTAMTQEGIIGTCNAGRCTCANGWTGAHCRTPPPEKKCATDSDCGWGGKVRGVCDTAAKKCVCAKDADGNPLYSGNLCEVVLPAAATVDSDPSMGDALLASLLTPQFLASFVLDDVSEKAVTYLLKNGFGDIIKQAMKSRLSKSAAQALASSVAVKLGTRMAMKMETMLLMKGMTQAVFKFAAAAASRMGAAAMSGPYGTILMAIVTLIQIWGAIIDGFDVRGLNMQMAQSTLDMIGQNMMRQLNNSSFMADAGIRLPRAVSPSDSVAWAAEKQSTENRKQLLEDMGDYISRLTVNSDGQDIIALPGTPAALSAPAAIAAETRPFYLFLTGNDDVKAARLKDMELWLWPLVGVSVVIVTVIVVAIVRGARSTP